LVGEDLKVDERTAIICSNLNKTAGVTKLSQLSTFRHYARRVRGRYFTENHGAGGQLTHSRNGLRAMLERSIVYCPSFLQSCIMVKMSVYVQSQVGRERAPADIDFRINGNGRNRHPSRRKQLE